MKIRKAQKRKRTQSVRIALKRKGKKSSGENQLGQLRIRELDFLLPISRESREVLEFDWIFPMKSCELNFTF